MMINSISRYESIEMPGTIISVVQNVLDKSPPVTVVISGNKVSPKLSWKDSVISITYSTPMQTQVTKLFRCLVQTLYNPDYLLKHLDSLGSDIKDECYHKGILRSNDLDIIWGSLPKNLSLLRESIFDYVVNKHTNIEYNKPYHWARAYTYCLQLLDAYGLISVYRYLQPIHCKNYEILPRLEIEDVITPNYIDKEGTTISTLVAKVKKELQELGTPLQTIEPLKDFSDSNQGSGALLEGFCLIILGSLTKPKEFDTWIL